MCELDRCNTSPQIARCASLHADFVEIWFKLGVVLPMPVTALEDYQSMRVCVDLELHHAIHVGDQ